MAIDRLDRIVRSRVLTPDVARVKVWNAEGKILYSDEERLSAAGSRGSRRAASVTRRNGGHGGDRCVQAGERLREQSG